MVKYQKSVTGPAVVFPMPWTVFALALLAKPGLHARAWHYGSALAMPAFVASACLLVWLVPLFVAPERAHRIF